MNTILLISCGSKKVDFRTTAELLYIGSYYKANLKYCKSTHIPCYIISAKHGLLSLDEFVDPYNCKMNVNQEITTEIFQKQMEMFVDTNVVVSGGSEYFNFIKVALPNNPCYHLQDFMGLEHKGMGYQIQWYQRNIGNLPEQLKTVLNISPTISKEDISLIDFITGKDDENR